jgi:DNA-binding ferritin-like protein
MAGTGLGPEAPCGGVSALRQGPCRAVEAGDGRTVNLLEDIRDEQQKVLWML